MKQQISKRMLDLRIEWLNKALNRPLASYTRTNGAYTANVGNFHLDKNIGGWQICEMIGDKGGVSCPFGHQRMTKAEIVTTIDAVLEGIKMAQATTLNTVCVTFPNPEEAQLFADKIKMAMENPDKQLSGVHLGILRDRAAKATAVKMA